MSKLFLLIAALLVLFSTSVSAQVDLDDALAWYWNFEQTTGQLIDIFNASDSTANNATDKSATGIVNGKGAWNFQEEDENFATLDPTDMGNIDGDYSISIWLRPEKAGAVRRIAYGQNGEEIMTDSSPESHLKWNAATTCTAGFAPTVNEWIHILLVVNGSSQDTCTMYVNGVPIVTTTGASVGFDTSNWAFGRKESTGGNSWDGDIDDTAIWNRALDQADALELNNSGVQAECTGDPCTFAAAGGPLQSSLTITAVDRYDGTSLVNFTVTLSNSTVTLTNTTTTGTLKFGNVANITSYIVNITSNNSGGYFDVNNTNLSINGSTTKEFEMFQVYAIFNSTQMYSGIPLDGLTVSAPLQNNNSADNIVVLFLAQGTFSINASATGQFNESISITVTPLQNFTQVLTFANARFNITAFNSLNNGSIDVGYTINVTAGNGSASTVSISRSTGVQNLTDLPLLQGYNFTLTVEFTGGNFIDTSRVLVVETSTGLFSIFSAATHSVNIDIFNEETNLKFESFGIPNVSVTLEFIGPSVRNVTTLNGSIYVANLTPGDYEIRYESDLFTKRSFFFRLPAGGTNDLDLFLLNSTLDTLIVVTIVDENDDPLNATILQVQRFYAADNAFKTIEMGRANFNGEVPINIVQDTQEYRFLVLNNDITTLIFSSAETKITGTTLKIRVTFGGPVFESVVGMTNVLTTMTHVESGGQSNFTFTFVDTRGFAISGCLDVTQLDFRGQTTLCQVCSSSSSATLECSVNATGEIIAIGTINDSTGQKIPVQTLTVQKIEPETQFGGLGVMLAFFLIFAIVTIGLSTGDLSMTMITGIIGLGVTAAMGLYVVSAGIVFTLLAVALVIILMGRNK